MGRHGEDGSALGHSDHLLLDVGQLRKSVHAIHDLEHLEGGEQLPCLLLPPVNSVPLQTRGRVKLLMIESTTFKILLVSLPYLHPGAL